MKKSASAILLLIVLFPAVTHCSRNKAGNCKSLIYDQPAFTIYEAFYPSNGSLGFYFSGKIKSDDFVFKIPPGVNNIHARQTLNGGPGESEMIMDSLSPGFLRTDFTLPETAEEYHRTFNPCTKIATIDFICQGNKYHREAFVSSVDSIAVIRFTADKPLSLTFSITAGSLLKHKTRTEERSLITDGFIPFGASSGKTENPDIQITDTTLQYRFRIFARIMNSDGLVSSDSSEIHIEKAGRATILVSVGMVKTSDYNSSDEKIIAARNLGKATFFTYDELKKRHLKYLRKINRNGIQFFSRIK